jgi:hypothetical protein
MCLIFLVILQVIVGLGFLIHYVVKKIGYPRIATFLVFVYGIAIVVSIIISIFFQDQSFSKNDAKTFVQKLDIELVDDFDLIKNESTSAPGDYYHTFTLAISDRDRSNAIKKIKNSNNFDVDKPKDDNPLYIFLDPFFGPTVVLNYQTDHSFIRDYFKPSGREGHAYTYYIITISKTTNELVFEDIVE